MFNPNRPFNKYSFVGGHKSSKIMRFVDKITKSKYFQKATETEFIKKKMEEVSNTPLLLTVEVQELHGTLAVNIPPPPTDRIWYVKKVLSCCVTCGMHRVKVQVYQNDNNTFVVNSFLDSRYLYPKLKSNYLCLLSKL